MELSWVTASRPGPPCTSAVCGLRGIGFASYRLLLSDLQLLLIIRGICGNITNRGEVIMSTADFIVTTISLASLALSIGMWVYTLWKNRANMSSTFDYKDNLHFCCFTDYDKTSVFLHIPTLFENHSSLPISITQILLIDKSGNSYRAHFFEGFASHRFRRMIDTDAVYEKITETARFPIYMGELGARYEILSFSFPASTINEISEVRIYTNRKRFVKKDQLETLNKELLSKRIIVDDASLVSRSNGSTAFGYDHVVIQGLNQSLKK